MSDRVPWRDESQLLNQGSFIKFILKVTMNKGLSRLVLNPLLKANFD